MWLSLTVRISRHDPREELQGIVRPEKARKEKPKHNRPRVYFEEWGDPMITGIGWESELTGIAGGEDTFPEKAAEPVSREGK